MCAEQQIPEGWEDWLAFFSARLPRPVQEREGEDGTFTFTGGDPGEVIVQLTPSVIRVAEFSVRATDGLTISPHWLGRIYWRRMPSVLAIPIIERLIDAAREMRHARFATCQICEKRLPPEWMFDDTICQRCADSES